MLQRQTTVIVMQSCRCLAIESPTRNSSVDEIGKRFRLNHAVVVKKITTSILKFP